MLNRFWNWVRVIRLGLMHLLQETETPTKLQIPLNILVLFTVWFSRISSCFFASFAIRLSLVCELFNCYARMMIMLVFSYSTPCPKPSSSSSLPFPPAPFANAVSCASLRRYVAIVLYYKKKLIILWAFAVCVYLLTEYVFINIDNWHTHTHTKRAGERARDGSKKQQQINRKQWRISNCFLGACLWGMLSRRYCYTL